MIRVFLVAFCAASLVQASSQSPERIRYQNSEYAMHTLPLEFYFSASNPRPEFLEETSSACWRGYTGRWEIREDRLFLAMLNHGDGGDAIALESVIAGAAGAVKASWFSGTLALPQGKVVRPVHMGFGTRYERSILIEIENGTVVATREEDYDADSDAYRSESDLEFVAMKDVDPGAAPKDDGKWVDGRLMATRLISRFVTLGKPFKTRGIILPTTEKTFLWIPETPRTQQQYVPLSKTPQGVQLRPGMRAEITGHFAKVDAKLRFHAISIRDLAPGETIHHADFADQIKQLRKKAKTPTPKE